MVPWIYADLETIIDCYSNVVKQEEERVMGVFINGFDMPVDCKSCNLLDYEDGYCLVHGRRTADGVNVLDLNCNNVSAGNRHPECPLVSSTHKHLIDADALLDKFEKESKAADEHGRDFSSCFMRGNTPCAEWWTVMQMVEDAMTVADIKRELSE